jgi:hypothetical protein
MGHLDTQTSAALLTPVGGHARPLMRIAAQMGTFFDEVCLDTQLLQKSGRG